MVTVYDRWRYSLRDNSIENSDVVILINMQKRKKDGKMFLSFLSCKNRYKDTDLKYFNQPFNDKTFNLEDDILCKKPKGVVSLSTDFEDIDLDLYEKRGRHNHMILETDTPVAIKNDLFALNPLS